MDISKGSYFMQFSWVTGNFTVLGIINSFKKSGITPE